MNIQFTPDIPEMEDVVWEDDIPTQTEYIGDMPEYPGFQPSATHNTWWALEAAKQAAIQATIPHKDSWTLDCYRNTLGAWEFSLPQYLTFNELLCHGTEKALDWHFIKLTQQMPKLDSHIKLTCYNGDLVVPEEYTTKLAWLYEDPFMGDSNFYYDTVAGMDCWLCPYLQTLFKSVPITLYLQMEATPNG